jgi:hypothetical protein
MPKKLLDYKKTVIYKIVCKDLNIKELYVGHTTNFTQRKCRHKSNCINNKYNQYVYKFIRDNGGWENWDMIKICDYPCNNYEDACKKERECIESLNAILNKVIPGRTRKQYREDNKDNIRENYKQYYQNNKEKLNQKDKEYYENNKDKISEYQKEYQKEYYKDNKNKILEKQKEKIKCECGCIITKNNLKSHQKHINLLKLN